MWATLRGVTLEGEVVDASNNLPLEGAIVSLPGLGLSAVTDSLGYYRVEQVLASTHAIRVIRLGYEAFEADVPVNGVEVLALYLTPGPIPLEGIEVEVVGLDELDWRPVGTSRQAFIGPGEIEDLRDTYQSLDQVLRVRRLPQVRYIPPVQPGGTGPPDSNGCLRLVTPVGDKLVRDDCSGRRADRRKVRRLDVSNEFPRHLLGTLSQRGGWVSTIRFPWLTRGAADQHASPMTRALFSLSRFV